MRGAHDPAVMFDNTRSDTMQHDLREFLSRFVGTVVITLAPVVLVAFVSMPLVLGHHPGEARPNAGTTFAHMT